MAPRKGEGRRNSGQIGFPPARDKKYLFGTEEELQNRRDTGDPVPQSERAPNFVQMKPERTTKDMNDPKGKVYGEHFKFSRGPDIG